MSRYRRLKIKCGAFFFTLALADRGSDLSIRFGERARGHGAQADRKDRTRPAKPLLVLAPDLPPQVEPRLERVRSDDDAVVGKIDQFIDGRVMTRPLRPVTAVRIAGPGE
jgi:hypothetical protein